MRVFITGCSTGIGLAAAEHFAAKGYQVIATARNPESSEGLQSLIKSNDLNKLTKFEEKFEKIKDQSFNSKLFTLRLTKLAKFSKNKNLSIWTLS